LVLLVWILHVIFLHEGQLAWQRRGLVWADLPRTVQWRLAWNYGPHELWHTLRLVRPEAFALSLVFMGLTVILGGLRWQVVMRVQGLDLPLKRTLSISMIAQFFNAFLLGSTGGDLLKAYYAARETHHKKIEAVVTVFCDRLIGLFSMLLFASVMMLPNYQLLTVHSGLAALAGLVLAMMLACGAAIALAFWGGVSRRWPRARVWLRQLPKGDLLERSLEASRRFGRDRRFLLETLALSMVLNLICVLQLVTLVYGLRLHVSVIALGLIVPTIICLAALPITPSGLGVRENLYVWMLAAPPIMVTSTSALSLSLLAYAGFLFWSVLGGLVYLNLRDRQHLAEVTLPDNQAELPLALDP